MQSTIEHAQHRQPLLATLLAALLLAATLTLATWILPCAQYPVIITPGQVYAVEGTRENGSTRWLYNRSDNETANDEPITTGFAPEA